MRTKDQIFLALLADAVKQVYVVPDLRADEPVTIEQLRAKMDAAGLLDEATRKA